MIKSTSKYSPVPPAPPRTTVENLESLKKHWIIELHCSAIILGERRDWGCLNCKRNSIKIAFRVCTKIMLIAMILSRLPLEFAWKSWWLRWITTVDTHVFMKNGWTDSISLKQNDLFFQHHFWISFALSELPGPPSLSALPYTLRIQGRKKN